MNEHILLRDVFSKLRQRENVIVGPGDDCAVIDIGRPDYLLFASDQVVGDSHYLQDQTLPEKIAAKLVKRNISDIAAMGGKPDCAVSTVALSRQHRDRPDWLSAFFSAMNDEAVRFGLSICGGDVSSSHNEHDVFSLSILGWVDRNKLCLRKNARHGDGIFCTGTLGNAFASGYHLDFTPRLAVAQFVAGDYTDAMIDLSDGLLKDLGRVIESSGTGAALAPSLLPLRNGASMENALRDGEDYELLFFVPAEREGELMGNWRFDDVCLTRIGQVSDDHCGRVFDMEHNRYFEPEKAGFDHFEK